MSVGGKWIAALITGGVLLCGCAAQSSTRDKTETRQAGTSILAFSRPASGSTVGESVDALVFRFDPPARLDEVTVSGPDGLMPMMVHSLGETSDYSLPLSGLSEGIYTVSWRATSQGRGYQGSYSFTVK
jgi:methionine-rich copper-binding protein CopC